MTDIARSDLDLFSDELLDDPYPAYALLRSTGAAVWMNRLDMWALPRYAEVRAALLDWETFSSQDAVCVGEEHNKLYTGSVLSSDPPQHGQLRAVLAPSLAPTALTKIKAEIERRADDLVADLVSRREFDAVGDLAAVFPVAVVADLIGLPDVERDRLLDRADASFNIFGPVNDRAVQSMWTFPESFQYIQTVATRERLTPGSMGAAVYAAADRGEIGAEHCLRLMLAYLFAGMDTTVNAVSNAIWLLAQHPDQWKSVRSDQKLLAAAFEEGLRLETPVQVFGRRLKRPYVAEGVSLRAGDRVMLLYGSANRDERRFARPDEFDVNRGLAPNLAFGMGIHLCPGQGLARLEAQAILSSLAKRVERIEVTALRRHLNNSVRGLGELHVRVH